MKSKPAFIILAVVAMVALMTLPALAFQERGQPAQSGERGTGGAVNRPSGGGEGGGRPVGGGSSPAGTSSSGGSTFSGGPAGSSSGGSSTASSYARERGGDYGHAAARRAAEDGAVRMPPAVRGDNAVSKGASAAAAGEISAFADGRGPVREVPQYSRPRGDRPSTGEAVPRGTGNPPPSNPGRPGYPGYPGHPGHYPGYPGWYPGSYPPYWGYDYWFYYPYYYPYGYGYPWYGSFGMGFLYYDPCWWAGGPGCYASGYGYGAYGGGAPVVESGSVRLKVKPKTAEVYVDGIYAGVVDQYDGMFQSLHLTTGGHRIEIRAPGYEPIVFDLLVPPSDKVTYTGELHKKLQ